MVDQKLSIAYIIYTIKHKLLHIACWMLHSLILSYVSHCNFCYFLPWKAGTFFFLHLCLHHPSPAGIPSSSSSLPTNLAGMQDPRRSLWPQPLPMPQGWSSPPLSQSSPPPSACDCTFNLRRSVSAPCRPHTCDSECPCSFPHSDDRDRVSPSCSPKQPQENAFPTEQDLKVLSERSNSSW